MSGSLDFRISSNDNTVSTIFLDDTSIKGWLPGKIEIDRTINLPEDFKTGVYELAIGIVDKTTKKAVISLAIEGRGSEGWYPIGSFRLR